MLPEMWDFLRPPKLTKQTASLNSGDLKRQNWAMRLKFAFVLMDNLMSQLKEVRLIFLVRLTLKLKNLSKPFKQDCKT